MSIYADSDLAAKIADAFLRRDFSGESELTRRIRSELSVMADGIARTIVQEFPAVRELMEKKAREAVTAVMVEDAIVAETVVRAVAVALADRRAGLEDREG